MPRMIYSIGEILEETPGIPNLEELLDGLAWVAQVDMHDRLNVQVVIKPDWSLTDPVGLLAQLGDSYSKIVAVLMKAGVAFWRMPELTITGKAHGCDRPACDCTERGFHEIEARVKIELHYPKERK